MRTIIILSILFSFNIHAKYSNHAGDINEDGVKVIKYNLCLEGKKYYEDKSGSLTEAGTGTCSMDKIPKYHSCKEGIAYKYNNQTKELETLRNNADTADLTCTVE